jgi:hypothetical protein
MRRTTPMPFSQSVGVVAGVGLRKAGVFLQRQTIRTLTTGKRTGRIYTINGRPHQASAAGEAPAKQTGRLSKSVGHNVMTKRLTVGEIAPYAGYLERGTSRMAARPHLLATFNRNQNAVSDMIGRAVMRVF